MDRRQKIRVERLSVGVAATLMTMGMTVAIAIAGFLSMRDAAVFVGGAALCAAVFYALIRSGVNLRFRDPSLTVPMMLAAGALITYLVLVGPQARPAFISFYIVAFMFGVLTLSVGRLALVALAYVGFYAGMIVLSVELYKESAGLQRELFRLLFFALLLAWFTVLGGYVSGLRTNLRTANEDLAAALGRAEALATTDPLTGCSNRRHLVEQLELEAKRATRGHPFSVCMVDIDRFKSVNDDFGHAAGDEVLKSFVAVAQKAMRPTDHLGRWGGEEFLVVLSQTPLGEALTVAERLRALMEATTIPVLPEGRKVTVSIGVSEHKADEPALQTVERADQAMYKAKQAGRNRVESGLQNSA